ncbi:MAG: hypothetical protein ONB25_15060, partial [candidate division KSB1 bacterium]|nr:hypothetical protein [candidate division KSB1 bacterium]
MRRTQLVMVLQTTVIVLLGAEVVLSTLQNRKLGCRAPVRVKCPHCAVRAECIPERSGKNWLSQSLIVTRAER